MHWVLNTACFPAVSRFALIAYAADRGERVTVSDGARFDKRYKDSHRFTIADTRGALSLTIPIASPKAFPCRWSDIIISDHGRWTQTLPTALESAYGRTPYFEFYIDSLLPLSDAAPGASLTEFNRATESLLCQWFSLPAPEYSAGDERVTAVEMQPLSQPYWQVRADTLGFIPGLSALDLLFNLGPEATFYLNTLSHDLF